MTSKLQEYIYRTAKKMGGCEHVEDILHCKSDMDLALLYFKYIDFCFTHNFPSADVLRDNETLMRSAGIIQRGSIVSDGILQRYALINNARLDLTLNEAKICFVYLNNVSNAVIRLYDNAIVSIEACSGTQIKIEANNQSTALIKLCKTADLVTIEKGGIVQVRRYERDTI